MSDFFTTLAARAADTCAGSRAGVPVTHGALALRVRAWTGLAQRTPGPAIALFHDDSLEFAAALLGAWQAGKTVWLAADTLPATCATLRGSVDAFWGQYPLADAVPSPGDAGLCAQPWHEPAPAFAALVIHTSGSTGAPKAIAKQWSQLTSELAALEAQFGAALGQAEILATVSHQHIYGLLFRVLWPLRAGRPLHAHGVDHPETLAPALALRPCVLVASPAHLKRLPAHLEWAGAKAHLRAVFSSGGVLAPEAGAHAAALLGQAPLEVYGSSETGGIAWRQGAGDPWQTLPGVAVRIDAGALAVLSPHAGSDWLALADLADPADGGFFLRGRSDRIVKIEEKRVSLDAIEAALVASGLAFEARVLPLPERAGQRQALAAFVVPAPAARALIDSSGKAALNARLRSVLAGVVEAVALPRRWRYLDQLPVNAQGKTSQAALLALLEARPRLPTVRILETDAARVLFELTVAPELLYFDGHFTVAPVLPGVVQVDWAILFGRRHFVLAPAFRGMHALKFQQMIRPGVPVQLELVHDAARHTLHFRYFSDAGAHASGRILFSPDADLNTKDVC
jgi:acyl-CoA synthetase (AMP-forming)/AMP-acid ligase II/3-hydroxymyristoyl/3-hydroxydecanoyl-(acyl carrier protein) dehydratase